MAAASAKRERPPAGPLGGTDPTRWRLDSSHDRHVWHYDRPQHAGSSTAYETVWGPRPAELLAAEQNDETKYWLGLDLPAPEPPLERPDGNPYKAAQNGFEFYKRLQASDGHWSGEYGGPLFLLPGIVIAMYVTKTSIPDEWKIEIARYLSNIQRSNGPGDQGWGIHIEAQSSVFGTGLNYVVLRLLGVDVEEPMMIRARVTLHHLGGCTGIPSWGKFWLAILNVHSWSGLNPTPTELWLLPEFLPIHPHRWWIHTRNVYIPMGYLNGRYFQADVDPLILSLRQELYVQPYASIKWSSCRNNVCPVDLYAPHSAVANGLFAILNVYDRFAPSFIRKRGLARAYELVKMEDDNTSYQSVGPVSKAMHMICRWLEEGPDSDAFKAHLSCIRDFMWVSSQGMMMTGTNGSQLWDTSFIGQALVESGLALEPSNKESLEKVLDWLDHSQIRENPLHFEKAYRHRTKGAWPFSTKEQGYTVSDCTAEGMKTVIMLQDLPAVKERVSKERLCDAIDTILTMQNADGGFASYELIRGPHWLEWLNPAEVFANIMTEYSYPECTTACVTALSVFKRKHPDYRADDIERVSKRAIEYIHKKQRPDGSWYGSWAICFTYAGMFAIESLSLAGEHYDNSESVKKACEFLLSKQMEDGGWGESYKSCETEQYVHHAQSQVTQTAWAVIGLITAQYPDPEPIRRGCRLIMSRQLASGEWPQEAIEGVFNKNAAISYPNYAIIFDEQKFAWTINALGQAWKYVGKEEW
ncbi:BQ2448_8007 [Microbotryum intermedium]|uniref:Terpene cyclase/mutase family member n=1 Tax=Microbotryum intermedium TaxID=269621 RepID=A0A238FUT6_9BASI|nr:BQ2448_8007 [Microbotryum intermedium]